MLFNEFLNKDENLEELFGSKDKAKKELSLERAAGKLIKQPKGKDAYEKGLVNSLIDSGVLWSSNIVKKVKNENKRKFGFALYLLLLTKERHGGMMSFGASSLLKHKDKDIRRGAELAKEDLDKHIRTEPDS